MYLKTIILALLICSSTLLGVEKSKDTVHPVMKKFDKNHDGKIFFTEASKNLQEHFCQYDVDQDGYLNEKEVKEVPDAFAEDDNKRKEP
jgi:Ca2+-binding EF-hand superfamily protein